MMPSGTVTATATAPPAPSQDEEERGRIEAEMEGSPEAARILSLLHATRARWALTLLLLLVLSLLVSSGIAVTVSSVIAVTVPSARVVTHVPRQPPNWPQWAMPAWGWGCWSGNARVHK